MTRRDYVKIASAFKKAHPPLSQLDGVLDGLLGHVLKNQWLRDINLMADVLTDDDPGFDREGFLRICGVTHEENTDEEQAN